MSSLYIYSLIVECTIMGDDYAHLLRAILLKRAKTCVSGIHSEFIHTHFFPLQDNSCTIISVVIYSKAGVLVKLLSGKVVISLHLHPIVKRHDGLVVSVFFITLNDYLASFLYMRKGHVE